MHWLQVYMAQPLNHWAALSAYKAELRCVFNYIHSKTARTVLSLSFHNLMLFWGCFAVLCQWSETRIVVQKTLFVARTLCKRSLLGDIPVTPIFFHYKTMDKINTSVCIYKILSTMFLVSSVPYVKQFYVEAHIAPNFKWLLLRHDFNN